jgi:tetratricopeptide (TPR) repeat protein
MIPQTRHVHSRLHGLSQSAIRSVVVAARALELGRTDEANKHIIALLALNANHAEVLRLLAASQRLRGDMIATVSTMQQVVALRPDDAQYRNALGAVLIDSDRFDEAIETLRDACKLDPRLAVAWFNLGLALKRTMRIDESAAALRRSANLSAEQWPARVILGDMLKAQGHLDEATAEYRRILRQHPHTGIAWWGLASVRTGGLAANDIGNIKKATLLPGASDNDVVAMGFALAKILDDEGRCQESLSALANANARARRHHQWDAQEYSAKVDMMLSAFTPPQIGASEPIGKEVIFIVSLPRSGSTLIEQVLASHSQVEGAGELSDLPQIFSEESRRRGKPLPFWAGALQPDDWTQLGRSYLERTARWRGCRPRFTDKLPSNWFYIGAIRAMLPESRIIIGRRDPLETCFSCYRQHFVGNEYTRTFADLAAFWRDFDRAARHWCCLHPSRVFESGYEDLIADPDAGIRRLLAFCDLPFEPACLDFHNTVRDVHTPSAEQVRQPLRRNTARADDYGGLLDPLRATLGMRPFQGQRSQGDFAP